MYFVWFSGDRILYRNLKSPCINLFHEEIIPGVHSTNSLNPGSFQSWEKWSLFVYKGTANIERRKIRSGWFSWNQKLYFRGLIQKLQVSLQALVFLQVYKLESLTKIKFLWPSILVLKFLYAKSSRYEKKHYELLSKAWPMRKKFSTEAEIQSV